MKDSDRPGWIKDNAKWIEYRNLEDRRMLVFHNWKQKRQDEFYEIVQPRLFSLIPELNNLERDYWISYAVYLRDFYEMWKERMERLETVIENEMPPDTLYLSAKDFQPEYSQYYQKNYRRLDVERNKRIFGEEYEELKYDRGI